MKSWLYLMGWILIAVTVVSRLDHRDKQEPRVPAARHNWKEALQEEGRVEAKRDIAAGKLRVKTYGLPVRWSWTFTAMARAELGVEYEAVAGCCVEVTLVEQVRGYNEVMHAEIDRRFGADAIDRVAERARVQHLKECEARGDEPVPP